MAKYEDGHGVKIEAGQVLNPDNFPTPNELVCIQVPKVFDQAAIRDCQTDTTVIHCATGTPPTVAFMGVENFDIKKVKVLSKTDSLVKTGFKKVKLAVTLSYDIIYSVNGYTQPPKCASVTFNMVINEIYCPNCMTQIGVVRYPEYSPTLDADGNLFKVEAIAEAFNDNIRITADGANYTFTLSLDIGVFFVVKCECVVQLLIPAYGYCPVPPEQQNPTSQTCCTFNDKSSTPFPTHFFPDQKWNPLDKVKKEDWDD